MIDLDLNRRLIIIFVIYFSNTRAIVTVTERLLN